MTPLRAQRRADQGNNGEDNLLSLLQKGQDSTHRLSMRACLLERRLRGGATPADLLLLVQDIKFAVEELQTLFRSAAQMVTRVSVNARDEAEAPAASKPFCIEVVDLGLLLTRCVDSVRQRWQRTEASLLCHIAPDLPSVTTDPATLAQVFFVLFEHLVKTSGKAGLEVRVGWVENALVIDIYDAGRGISKETYVALRTLVSALQGTLKISQELERRSRVELSFPPVAARGNGAS